MKPVISPVAKSIAAVLGAMTKKDGYPKGDGYLVSCRLGYLESRNKNGGR